MRGDTALLLLFRVRRVPEPSNLLWPPTRHRDLRRPQARSLLVGHVDDGEAAELLLGFGVRTIGDQGSVARRIDTEHRGLVVEPAGEDQDSSGLHLCPQRTDTFGRLAQIIVSEVGAHSSLNAMRYSVMQI